MASAGISGLAVAAATAGGVLVYAGFKNLSPVAALRQISGGKPAPVTSTGTQLAAVAASAVAGGGTGLGNAAAGAASAAGGAGVLTAAQKYINDKYSQSRRTQKGWSDCSSFADKVLSDVGIPPPVKWAATPNYRISGEWKNIPLAQARPGDIAINSHHMVVVTAAGGVAAIGQQNPRVNIRTGTVADLMSNDFVVKRYVGKR